MEKDIENKIELFVVFQEKLLLKMHDSDFRREIIEPLMYSGITEDGLDKIVESVFDDEEIKQIASGLSGEVKGDLKIFVKKMVERFSKFRTEPSDDYIG